MAELVTSSRAHTLTLVVITNNGCWVGGCNSALCSSRKGLREASVSFDSKATALVSSLH